MRTGRTAEAQSTAAVLWLMILLVFLPIAAAHAIAWFAEQPADGHAQHAAVSD